MERRTALATIGIGLDTPLVGCLSQPGDSGDDVDGNDADGDATDENDGTDERDGTGDTGNEDSDVDDRSIDGRLHNAGDEPHTFELRILDGNGETIEDGEVPVKAGATERIPGIGAPGQVRTYEVVVDGTRASETLEFDVEPTPERNDGSVDVTYTGSGAVEIEGTFDIPDERGGEFRDVATWENTYEVTATLESGLSKTFTWTIENCTNSEAPNGSRNGSIRVEPNADDLSFVTDSCAEIAAGTAVPTGPAGQFEVDETE